MKRLLIVLVALLVIGVAGVAGATVLTFDDPGNLGVKLGGSMLWNGTGGGHLYMENYADDDFIIFFDANTFVNSYQMNAMPWESYGGGDVGLVDIAAFDPANAQVWSTTVDLRNYTAWTDWLTVNVNTGNIFYMIFYSPFNRHGNGFWPSIDNMVINVPEPATILLLGAGLLGAGILRKRFSKI